MFKYRRRQGSGQSHLQAAARASEDRGVGAENLRGRHQRQGGRLRSELRRSGGGDARVRHLGSGVEQHVARLRRQRGAGQVPADQAESSVHGERGEVQREGAFSLGEGGEGGQSAARYEARGSHPFCGERQ